MMAMGRAPYRAMASVCAELVTRLPILEAPMIRLGAQVWHHPLAGRFYRSVVGRYGERLRRTHSQFRRVTIGDDALVVDVTEFTTSTLYFGNVPYEPATTAYLSQHLGPGGVFVDVGANHGYFTLLAASRVGDGGRVFAFEPNPIVYQQLQRHVAVNHFENRVVPLTLALWDATGERRLFVSQHSRNTGLSSLLPSDALFADGALSPDRTLPVRTDTFDRWLATSGVEHVDLVKIDAEGAERQIVEGMAGALGAGRVGALVCETELDGETHARLCQAGFVPQPLETNGRLTNIAYARR